MHFERVFTGGPAAGANFGRPGFVQVAMRPLCLLLALSPVALAADAENAFAHDLFARLAGREGNLVCSPMSVRLALAMVYGGARGPTATEMAKVLRCDDGIHAEFARLAKGYDGRDGAPALADAAWVQAGAALLPAYLDLMMKHYGATPLSVDFAAAGAASERINAWAADRTRGRIKDLVNPSMFDANTTLVLTNALHFKAAWQEPFRARATSEQPFALASGEKVPVPLMAQTEHFAYAERDGVQAVELPYAGGRFSMVVVLPRVGAPDAVPEGLLTALEGESVSVCLPRFRIEAGFRLEDTLAAMGMGSAFGRDADFSGMNGRKDLFLSAVAHKAFVAVDEEGTEAAAATAAVQERKGRPGKPVVFRADRPFLFLIRDRETGSILFLGRVSDPR